MDSVGRLIIPGYDSFHGAINSALHGDLQGAAYGTVKGGLETATVVMGGKLLSTGFQALSKVWNKVTTNTVETVVTNTTENAASNAAGSEAKAVISTGRTVPNNLKEKLAMEQVMAKPEGLTPPRMPTMNDAKNGLYAKDGWVKRTQNVDGVEIHYVENTKTGEIIDFKFKD